MPINRTHKKKIVVYSSMEILSTMKMNPLQVHATTRMTLNLMLSKEVV